MKINSFDKDVQNLLGSAYYIIPRFQRPYSWDKENIIEFWTDTIARKEEDYFIGSIVVYKEKHDLYGIVDGQQRLTTITIILCCLRNFLRSEGFRELSEGIHALVERKDIESRNQFIIQTETSFPYFQEYIQKSSSPSVKVEPKEEEKNLESAYKQINEYLGESIKSIKADPSIKKEDKADSLRDKLVSFREKILRLKVIFVELDTEDDAYLIFETLNTRGKDLSPSDLVKNLLARFVKPENPQVDSVKLIWQRILNTVEGAPGQVSIDNFLQHYWLSKYEYTSVKNLFRNIRREIQRDNANDYLNDLEYHSKIYRSLFEPTFRTWRNDEDNIKKSLEAFVQFRVRQPLPLLISIMSCYDKKLITKKQTEKILASVESFIFIYTAIVTTQSTGGLSMMYSNYARSLAKANTAAERNDVLGEIRTKLKGLLPSYDEYRVTLEQLAFTNTNTKQRSLIKYILSKLYELAHRSHIADYNLMTIEHILPQSEIGKNGNTEESVGSLGNLLLISAEINDKLANKLYPQKKKILAANGYIMDNVLSESATWSKEQIAKRMNWIAEISYKKIWKV